jgi:hypothetical protein
MADASPAVEQLLSTARRAAARGEIARARAVVRAMSAQYPGERTIWELLADIAETDAERQLAIVELAALTPHIDPAPPAVLTTSLLPHTAEDADRAGEPAPSAARARWPALVVLAVAGIALLMLALWRWGGPALQLGGADPPRSSAAIPVATLATLIPTQPTGESGAPTAAQIPVATATVALQPSPTARPQPTSTPRPALSPGAIIDTGTWVVTLLRPDDLMLLDGSIGGVQPTGRFALALVAVHHNGPSPARIPADLIALVDSAGERYLPLSGASTTYLSTYGRGTYGDLSLEEPIIPEIGQVSVPLVFDVPLDASGLQLVVADNPAGWPIQTR